MVQFTIIEKWFIEYWVTGIADIEKKGHFNRQFSFDCSSILIGQKFTIVWSYINFDVRSHTATKMDP